MSSREHLAERAKNAIAGVRDEWDIPTDAALAKGVLNALLPQITEMRQLFGVPEGSLLIDIEGNPYRLTNGQLVNERNQRGRVTQPYINKYGPLTVVWMP
jgi:hypothetical protein